MKLLPLITKIVFSFFATVFLANCGGGTTGTSSTGGGDFRNKTISGSIVDETGAAVVGAVVRINGENDTVTDSTGHYETQASVDQSFNFSVEQANKEYSIEVSDSASDSAVISLDAVINRVTNSLSSRKLEGSVLVTGSCKPYANIQGNIITLTLPKQVTVCSLTYYFTQNTNVAPRGEVKVKSSNCSDVSVVKTGGNNNGGTAELFQAMYINKLPRSCSISLGAAFDGFISTPTFTLNLVPNSRDDQGNPVKFHNGDYHGTLSLVSSSGEESKCLGSLSEIASFYNSYQGELSGLVAARGYGGKYLQGAVTPNQVDQIGAYVLHLEEKGRPNGIITDRYTLKPERLPGSTTLDVTFSFSRSKGKSTVCTKLFKGTFSSSD